MTQLFLIAGGLTCQMVAFSTLTSESIRARLALAAEKEREAAEASEAAALERETAAKEQAERRFVPKVVRYRRDVVGVMEHVPDEVRPADLLRTAKVHFKPSMKVCQGTQSMPTIQR